MVHAGCVFVAGIHPSRTWMSGSFEFTPWNACVHRLDLCLYSHSKEFLRNGARTHVNSKGKIPSTGNIFLRGVWNLQHCIKQDSESNTPPTSCSGQHTTNDLFRPCAWLFTSLSTVQLHVSVSHSLCLFIVGVCCRAALRQELVMGVFGGGLGRIWAQNYNTGSCNDKENDFISMASFYVKHVQWLWTSTNTKILDMCIENVLCLDICVYFAFECICCL